jgi:tRNA A37 threonylcarbamoyladenosine modification protein TsaB
MLVFIDPTDQDTNVLALVTQKKIYWSKFRGDRTSENLLLEVKKLLNKHKYQFDDLTKIGIVVGPGSFSKIRTGVATANALGYALGLRLVAIKKDSVPENLSVLLERNGQKLVRPFYGRQPHITKPRKK